MVDEVMPEAVMVEAVAVVRPVRDYSKGMIYKLCCKDPTITDVYIGSTLDMRKRKAAHKSVCNNPNNTKYNLTVYTFIRDNGGWNNWDMILVERFPCNSKRDLEVRERYWLEQLTATLNNRTPGVNSAGDVKQYNANRYEANKEVILEQVKQYYEANKQAVLEYQKQYYEANRDVVLEQQKKYYEANKQRLNSKVTCECGCKVTKKALNHHKTSKKHINLTTAK